GRNAESASLPDGEMDDAVVAAEDAAVEIDDIARLRGARPQPFDHFGVAAGRHEADVLAVVLVGDRKPKTPRKLARFHLAALAEREAENIELVARGGEEEIALVAFGIARTVERATSVGQAARRDVMAGGENLCAEFARRGEEIAEFDRLVALHARHRRLARDVARREAVDHHFLEAALVVEHVMRDADALSDRARIVDILTRAAGAL